MVSTQPNLRTIPVALEQNGYPVAIGAGAITQLGARLTEQGWAAGTKVLIVTNPVVQEHYGSRAKESLQAAGYQVTNLVIEAGEDQKTPATVARIHDAAFERKLERGSLIVALGGGVVGDMAGFAAATWLRVLLMALRAWSTSGGGSISVMRAASSSMP